MKNSSLSRRTLPKDSTLRFNTFRKQFPVYLFLMVISLLILIYSNPLVARSQYSEHQIKKAQEYLQTEYNLTGSDYELTGQEFNGILTDVLLNEKYQDVPLIEWVLSLQQADNVYNNMDRGDDLIECNYQAYKAIGEFLVCNVLSQLPPTSWLGLATKTTIKGICKLNDVNRFKDVAVRRASEVQLDRYFKARAIGITHEKILEGKDIYSQTTVLFDQGWIISVGDTAKPIFGHKPGVEYNEPDEFYEYSRLLWEAMNNQSTYLELKDSVKGQIVTLLDLSEVKDTEEQEPVTFPDQNLEDATNPDISLVNNSYHRLLRFIPYNPENRDKVYLNDYKKASEQLHITRPGPKASYLEVIEYWKKLNKNHLVQGGFISGFHDYSSSFNEHARKRAGYDLRDVENSILAGQPPKRYNAVELDLQAENVRKDLLEYSEWFKQPEKHKYQGIEILKWGEDFKMNLREGLDPPVYDQFGRGADLAFYENTLLYTSAWSDGLKRMIDAGKGEIRSLADLKDYQLITEELNKLGVYSAILVRNSERIEDHGINQKDISEDVANKIKSVHCKSYGTGIGKDENGFYMGLVLVHSNPRLAKKNASLLKSSIFKKEFSGSGLSWSDIFNISRADIQNVGNILTFKIPIKSSSSSRYWKTWPRWYQNTILFPVFVQDFEVLEKESHISLKWTNPEYYVFEQITIRRDTESYPENHEDGKEIKCNISNEPGVTNECIDNNVVSGQTYYYFLFIKCSPECLDGSWYDWPVENKNTAKIKFKVSRLTFPDKNLEETIRNAIDNPKGDIYPEDLEELTELVARRQRITNLEGIENCVNLERLDLGSNNITDISPLSGLKNLERLDLGSNNITDINALRMNKGLDDGDAVTLKNNYLDLTENSEDKIIINNLSTRGVKVEFKPQKAPVSIPDKNLEQVIRDRIGKPTGNIYPPDLNGVTELVAKDAGIVNLQGIENCVDLEKLVLGMWPATSNNITDISPLSGLTNLELLYLRYNNITDISPLSGLTNLEKLTLSSNNITDISPLSGLTNLEKLTLSVNNITDISPLSGLTNLEDLRLHSNDIVDISALSGLTNLRLLYLRHNNITDISALSGLTNLRLLSLGSNTITDISPLSNLTNLKWLLLYANNIIDISPLSVLTNLEKLVISHNKISDIFPLVQNNGLGANDEVNISHNYIDTSEGSADMKNIQELVNRGAEVKYKPQIGLVNFFDPNLEQAVRKKIDKPEGDIVKEDVLDIVELNIAGKGIDSLQGIENLSNLKKLNFRNNNVANISPLASLTKLEWLGFWANDVSDISPLANLTKLTNLYFWNNDVSDISVLSKLVKVEELNFCNNDVSNINPLANLTKLRKLYFWGNNVTDITPLAHLKNLWYLNFSDNNVSDISPLADATKLEKLYLKDNEISEILPLLQNDGLNEGDFIDLEENYLDLTKGSEDLNVIQRLIDRGVRVEYESQKELGPALINNLTLLSEEQEAILRWTNPKDPGLEVVTVRRKQTSYPKNYKDGEKVDCNLLTKPNIINKCSDTEVVPGNRYFYAVFTKNSDGYWNDQVQVSANAVKVVVKGETLSKSKAKNLEPLREGKEYRYSLIIKVREETLNGAITTSVVGQRQIGGEDVTIQKAVRRIEDQQDTSFNFFVERNDGIYQVATKSPADLEPQILEEPWPVIKYPVGVGYGWSGPMEVPVGDYEVKVEVKETVASVNSQVTVPAGTFSECVKTELRGTKKHTVTTSGYWGDEKKEYRIEVVGSVWRAPGVGEIQSHLEISNYHVESGQLEESLTLILKLEEFD